MEASIAVNDLVPQSESWLRKIMSKVMSGVGMIAKATYSWDLNLDQLNVVEMQTYQQYLQVVLDTRSVLKNQLNIPVQVNKFLQQYMDTAQIKSQKQSGSVEAAARTSFVGVFNQVKTNL